jgi:hypothetical protein
MISAPSLSRANRGAAGDRDRREVRDHGAPAVGGACADPRPQPQKWRRTMRSPTIPTAAAMAQSAVTRSCGAEPCPAPRTGGGSGWGCCNTAGSPRGCECGPRPRLPGRRPPARRCRWPVMPTPSWSGCSRRWYWVSRRGVESPVLRSPTRAYQTDTRRYDTLDTQMTATHPVNEAAATTTVAAAASPCPLDKIPHISGRRRVSSGSK